MYTAFCAELPMHSIKSCAESKNVINYIYNVYLLYKASPNGFFQFFIQQQRQFYFFTYIHSMGKVFFISLNQLTPLFGSFQCWHIAFGRKKFMSQFITHGTNKCNWFVDFTIFLRHLMAVFVTFASFCNAFDIYVIMGVFWW